MYKLSQKDLLSEGFWSTIGKGAMAGVKGIAKTLDYVAPELTNPIHGLEKGLRDIGSSIKQGWQGEQGTIKKNLEDQGYKVGNMKKIGDNWNVNVQEITYDNSGNEILGPNKVKVVNPEKTIRTSSQTQGQSQSQAPYQYGNKYYAPDYSQNAVKIGSDWAIPGYQVNDRNSRISNSQNIIIVDHNGVVKNVR